MNGGGSTRLSRPHQIPGFARTHAISARVSRAAGLVCLGLVLTSFHRPAHAVVYTFTQIASTTQKFSNFGSIGINESGEVVFEADLDSGGAGIFVGEGGPAMTIVEQTAELFTLSSATINDLGDVSFRAATPAGGFNIIMSDSSGLTTIADEGSVFSLVLGRTAINNAGQVAFVARDAQTNEKGLYVGSGGAPLLISSNLQPTGETPFSIGVDAAQLDIAFLGATPSPVDEILKRGDQNFQIIIADTLGSEFSDIRKFFSLDDFGNVAFIAEQDGVKGVFIDNGFSPFTFAVADSGGTYDFFTRVAKSNNGVAFEAQLDLSGGGVYTGADPLTDSVLRKETRYKALAVRQ